MHVCAIVQVADAIAGVVVSGFLLNFSVLIPQNRGATTIECSSIPRTYPYSYLLVRGNGTCHAYACILNSCGMQKFVAGSRFYNVMQYLAPTLLPGVSITISKSQTWSLQQQLNATITRCRTPSKCASAAQHIAKGKAYLVALSTAANIGLCC
jgi:hypothetical protein